MIEPLFGSGAPMWTAVPPTGFAFQAPSGIGNGPIAGPMFGSPNVPGQTGGVPTGVQPFPMPNALQTAQYGYGGGIALSPQSLAGPVLPAALLTVVAMRRGQPQGPTNDQEVEDFIYDALELVAGAADVEVRCEGGRATLTGTVQQKRLKHDVGEIAWAIPGLQDVQNNVTIASRRRTRGTRETEPAGAPGRKQG
jgi:hypothetical protein